MTEAEKLREAQHFVTRELQEHGAGRLDAMSWAQEKEDQPVGIYRLAIMRGGEKSVFAFTQYELIERFGSKQWEKDLRERIGEVLRELRYE
jgi:hypothetical protein